jgi:hypothetical protein
MKRLGVTHKQIARLLAVETHVADVLATEHHQRVIVDRPSRITRAHSMAGRGQGGSVKILVSNEVQIDALARRRLKYRALPRFSEKDFLDLKLLQS